MWLVKTCVKPKDFAHTTLSLSSWGIHTPCFTPAQETLPDNMNSMLYVSQYCLRNPVFPGSIVAAKGFFSKVAPQPRVSTPASAIVC